MYICILKGQYGSDCILLIRICKKNLENKAQKYHVMKIDEDFVEGRYVTIVFCEFAAIVLQKRKI